MLNVNIPRELAESFPICPLRFPDQRCQRGEKLESCYLVTLILPPVLWTQNLLRPRLGRYQISVRHAAMEGHFFRECRIEPSARYQSASIAANDS